MMIRISSLVVALLLAASALAGPMPELMPELAVFEPFVGKTYVGEFTDANSGKKATDVQSWEIILGGKAIRTMHSLNDGEYGGETIIYWDPKAQEVAYFYVTTGGFITRGTMEVAEGEFTAIEFVEGEAGGVTEVRSTSRVLEEGGMHLTSEFRKDGEWQPGFETRYVENPEAEVVFE